MSDITPPAGFCERCGARFGPGERFCAGCGAKLVPDAPAPVAAPAGKPAVAAKSPRAPGRWKRRARIALSALLALVVVAGIGLWPQYSALIPTGDADEGRVRASTWLSDGPAEPVVFTKRPVWATPAALKAAPDDFRQRLVLVSGEPVAVGSTGAVSLAALEKGGETIVVGYPGGSGRFSAGTMVSVAGVLSPKGDEILALAVSDGVPGQSGRNRDLAMLTLAASAAFALAAVFLRVRRRLDRRAVAAATVVAALLSAGLLGGCEIVIRTEVNRDGSGTVNTQVITGTESMEELMGLPNAQAFIDSWIASQEKLGLTVHRTTNQLKVDRTFSALEDFGTTNSMAEGSWSHLGSADLPDGRHVFFAALMDTSSVYPDAPEEGADTTAFDKLTEEIDASTLRYELKLPGTLLGENSDSKGVWQLSMGDKRFLFAESLTGASEADSRLVAAQAVWVDVVRWLFAVSAGLVCFGALAYPWRRKGGETRG